MTSRRFRRWCFTINGHGWEPSNEFLESVKTLVYQKEIGEENDNEHIQGYCEFKNCRRFDGVKELIGDVTVHIEKANGSARDCINYCSKKETRKEGTEPVFVGLTLRKIKPKLEEQVDAIMDGIRASEVILNQPYGIKSYKSLQTLERLRRIDKVKEQMKNHYKIENLNEWQEKAWNLLKNQNRREVLWVYDEEGNSGKSWFNTFICYGLDGCAMDAGNFRDMAYRYDCEEYVGIDCKRYFDFKKNPDFYEFLEALKDGRVESTKYESIMKPSFECKVVVLANCMPSLKALSKDRWTILKIDKKEEEKPYNIYEGFKPSQFDNDNY